MNIINLEMLDITDKQLICTSGNFIMGVKGDNNTTKVMFNVPDKFKLQNAICVLVTPDKLHQYSIPLDNFSFVVTSSISSLVGNWSVILMLTGNDGDTSMPVCISDAVIGTIKDSDVDTSTLETLPVDANLQILYNNMLTLYNNLQETLVNVDPSTLLEIEQDLNTILTGMSSILEIDWESLSGLAGLGQDLQEIKTLTTNMNANVVNSTTLINNMTTNVNSILSKANDINLKVDDLILDMTDLGDNIDLSITKIDNNTTTLGEIKTTTNSNTLTLTTILTKCNDIILSIVGLNDKIGLSTSSSTLFQNLENIFGITQSLYQMVAEGVISQLNLIKSDTTNIVDIKNVVGDTNYVNGTLMGNLKVVGDNVGSVKTDATSILTLIGTVNDSLSDI